MPCQILVAYQCAKPTGEVVVVVDGDHQFSALERLQANGGDHLSWSRFFTVLRITDKTKEALDYLTDPLMLVGTMEPTPHPSGLGRWYFGVPVEGTAEYLSLSTTGEIECTWSIAEPYLMERI